MRSGLKANSHVFNYYHLELAYFQALYTYGTSQVMDVGRRHHCHLLKVVLNVTFQNISLMLIILFKAHIFWESHKILRNLHLTFDWHKSKVKILQNFVAFSEYMNFKKEKRNRNGDREKDYYLQLFVICHLWQCNKVIWQVPWLMNLNLNQIQLEKIK